MKFRKYNDSWHIGFEISWGEKRVKERDSTDSLGNNYLGFSEKNIRVYWKKSFKLWFGYENKIYNEWPDNSFGYIALIFFNIHVFFVISEFGLNAKYFDENGNCLEN